MVNDSFVQFFMGQMTLSTHLCSKPTIVGSDNGLSPGQRQTTIWTNDAILLIEPLGANFSEILTEIYMFSFKKMHFSEILTEIYMFSFKKMHLKL